MVATQFAWLFEAESIQAYLHETGRLRDAVGASQIIDDLCGSLDAPSKAEDLLTRVLAAANVSGAQLRFSRRGGGAFIAFFADARLRDEVRALWAIAISRLAPGLNWLDASADGADELAAATLGMAALRESRALRLADPLEAGPLTQRAPRTGKPAVQNVQQAGRSEFTDAATGTKRRAVKGAGTVARRFSTDSTLIWPLMLSPEEDEGTNDEAFPFLVDGHELAFLHADGNGLGAVLHALAEACKSDRAHYVEHYMRFSAAVSRATQAAARKAAAVLIQGKDQRGRVPARPLVLGGDDLSIIVRPDLAIRFAEVFLTAFEEHSAHELQALDIAGSPKGLTAACGIAIVDSSYPFIQAGAMAEALCKTAKQATKLTALGAKSAIPASSLMFHRLTSALPKDDDELLAAESIVRPDEEWLLVGGPYVVHGGAGLPTVEQLRQLSSCLNDSALSRGPLRQLLALLHDNPAMATASWRNWLRAAGRRPGGAVQLSALFSALAPFGIAQGADLPFGGKGSDGRRRTPLADAMLLSDLEAKREG